MGAIMADTMGAIMADIMWAIMWAIIGTMACMPGIITDITGIVCDGTRALTATTIST